MVAEDVRWMMDKLPNLSPHFVTTPIALAAVGVVAVIFLALLGASWYAYVLVILILVLIFAAIIKFPQRRMEAVDAEGAEPRSGDAGSQEGVHRPWWRRVFGG
jgi:membrane protein implicated in regulation of membrane protease activity